MSVWSLIKEGVELFKNKKFGEAIEKLNQALDEIKDKDSHIQVQNNIQFWLGRCYFERAMKAKSNKSVQTKLNIVTPHNLSICLMQMCVIWWTRSFWERITKRVEIIARRKCFST